MLMVGVSHSSRRVAEPCIPRPSLSFLRDKKRRVGFLKSAIKCSAGPIAAAILILP
jgi:hypothetical protein